MKKTLHIIIAALILCSIGGCTEILDTAPYDKVATSNMWTTENYTDQGVASIYAALRDWTPYNGGWTSGAYGFDSWGMTGQHQYAEALLSGSVNTGYYVFSGTWQKTYEGIHRANDAIKNIPNSSVDDAKKGRLLAEAKFLRAYFYLRLNTLFGGNGLGVPLYLEPIEVDECTKGQSPEADVWAQIITDLTDAINEPNFPDRDATGRASKGAAYALRGKAYLIQGAKYNVDGTPGAHNTALLNSAVADFAKVAGCGYGLFAGGYKALFTEANEYCEEMIFSIQNIAEAGYGNRTQYYCGTRSAHSTAGTNCWGDYQVSPDVVDLYETVSAGGSSCSPFSWDAIIPGYSSKPVAQREVYFLRDTLESDGTTGKYTSALRKGVNVALQKADLSAAASEYLPSGNEARIEAAYANRDPRLYANVITPYYGTFKGYNGLTADMDLALRWPIQGNSAQPNSTTVNDMALNSNYLYYFHRKFVYEGYGVVNREQCPINDPLIRYADVLLMWAEALVELNDLSGAKAKVKEVRDRVNMPTMDANFADQAAARSYVRDERRREFVNEGINFFDEMRWRTWKQTKFKGGNGGQAQVAWGGAGYAGLYSWAGDHLYVWPVPASEIQRNPNLTLTPGWSY
jgi:hypothetical protein